MTQPGSRITRRRLAGLGTAAVLTGSAIYGARWYNITARNDATTLTPPQAHARATAGQLLLVDIRRPDEWALTGVGQGAHPLDMRRDDFAAALGTLVQGTPDRPVALICARGVRSRFMVRKMLQAGFRTVLDVPEGMLGSGAGPGWIKRGLPVTQL
ncbi:rhodanese-like domain-containing protein [Pseudosulfitobacter pseudonitzschiae]|uniref:rhodanese-like domain-containing protein n=1 Tax=Pseudosulfitobacter pseudonitzschiae TaxID=1402135 RepID=UPI001AF0C860|nr:rhodanese-like domain-containing protein [Pseudosulfitobacter pseudonitzschiae]MBM1815022.1 rhodanese-like domain-containing protein [Pseudosulfitobacter pseudonitzschiae]MBM1832013.1 rhodanese-like domain-containing protein [Pseudosulfitobacter pseudonitzschiae]MBM1836881.1 rhodanese-like domain-containing protein [Pseudosulfitobacter pseudonitzschiae]MBM1841727.1 rhodanese-like domain-containing protein [Pseudosulfitobacter pseudonitzschiae]MBM1846595.1 rhodanese-like domain-containing pr